MPEKVLKAIFILLFSVLGIVLSTQTEPLLTAVIPKNVLTETILGITILSLGVMLIGGILGALVGRVISGYLISSLFAFTSRVEKSLLLISTQDLIIGTLGLFAGLIIANLVGLAFGSIPYIGPYVSVALSIILGYIGMHLTISKKAEIAGWFHFKAESGTKQKKKKVGKLLDTNIIIDGRILNIYQSGFLEGPIIVPVFVLEELQKIADSADVLKRNRGRRGLDILDQIKKKSKDELIILTEDFEEINEVDSKLVKLARTHGYKIIALKPAVIPGEEVYVQLVKNGKEEGQGVAFLDDGTMIVVENGSQFIGQEIPVIIASVLQTKAGQIIFAKAKLESGYDE